MKNLSHWRHLNLASRFLLVTLLLLLFVQTAGFWVVRAAMDDHVRNEIDQSLNVAERIWERLLEQSSERLFEASSVLASDFGFRSAVATGDAQTIASALSNSASRIGASVTFLLDPGMSFIASSQEAEQPMDARMREWLWKMGQTITQDESHGVLGLYQSEPTQFVMAPIRAPRTIGYVLMGFKIDQSRVDELYRLSGIHMALVSTNAQSGVDRVVTSSTEFNLQTFKPSSESRYDVDVQNDTFLTIHRKQQLLGGDLQLMLFRSIKEAQAEIYQLQIKLAYITILGLLVFALASAWATRKITEPLVQLTKVTSALGHGVYEVAVQGTERRDEIGALARGFDTMRSSIAQQRDEILHLAYFDTLTGLPNRIKFLEELETGLNGRRELETPLIVLTINLDRFKKVNDILGYTMGDRLLVATANRLNELARRKGDLVARLSGDEFAVLLSRTDKSGAMDYAKKVQHALAEPLAFDDTMVDLSASIGIAAWPEDAKDAETLVNYSQVAMYAAKAKTEDIIEYSDALLSSSPENLSLLSDLRRAVNNDELRLFLQPKVATKTNKVIAAEALIRWEHPERGLVPPFQFVPFAEQTGFVRQLTKWIFEEAARSWKSLQPETGSLRISINLSTRDLMDPKFPEFLLQVLDKFNLSPDGFCLEITESAIMDDPKLAEATLNQLSQQGFRLSIDDFGTGYSSLGYLKRLPVNELKIDQSFVLGMLENENDAIIVRSTVDLAHNLGLDVVAEGVETEPMLDILKDLRCEEVQGYLIGKPMPMDQFIKWRKEWAEQQAETVA